MITFYNIENFKSFGKETGIELAPITLIYGNNSSGKSSVLQSLQLLKQSWENRQEGAFLSPIVDEKGTVDLGTFEEFIHKHNSKNDLKFSFGI